MMFKKLFRKELNQSELILEAVNAKYKEIADNERKAHKDTIKAIRFRMGRKYAKSAQIIDGKVMVSGIVLYGKHVDFTWILYAVMDNRNKKIDSLADFGDILEKKYSVEVL